MEKGLLIVLSGPSGAGKGTVYNAVCARDAKLHKSISVTTRSPREGEQEGVHYYFRTEQEYARMKENGEFLETADVYKHKYGTPAKPVFDMLDKGEDVFFEIDVAGAKQIKAKYPESILIYLMPPSFEILEQRLRGRRTEDEDSLRTRLGSARSELRQYGCFDYIVFNDVLENATQDVADIIEAEREHTRTNVTQRCAIAHNEQKIQELLAK